MPKIDDVVIDGLPEGQKITGITVLGRMDELHTVRAILHLDKIRMCSITLVKTDEKFKEGDSGHTVLPVRKVHHIDNATIESTGLNVWREAKENNEPKLGLSVDEVKELDDYINSECVLSEDLETKINKFVEDK